MLYIIRHGKTDWNVRHKMQGRTDIPLNEEGRQMAEAAREEYRDVHFDICFCSPLIRARETAEILLCSFSRRNCMCPRPAEQKAWTTCLPGPARSCGKRRIRC